MIITLLVLLGLYRKPEHVDKATQTENSEEKNVYPRRDIIIFKTIPEEDESDLDLCNSVIPDAKINALYDKYIEKF